MSYDPRDDGALCNQCFLFTRREGNPVPSEHHDGAIAAIIGEAPGADEIESGRPFVGASGQELIAAIRNIGKQRQDFSYINTLSCRPKKNNLDLALHEWQKLNRVLVKRGDAPKPHPVVCCTPRLHKELAQYENLIPVGKVALSALTGMNQSILDLRGGPIELWQDDDGNLRHDVIEGARHFKILPTVHPAFVTRMRRWTGAFRADIGRAVRWFTGRLGWREPTMNLHPTPEQVEQFFRDWREYPIAYDVETDGIEPLTCDLRCVGFATVEAGICVPFLSIDGQRRFYASDEEAWIKEILCTFFLDRSITKIAHNNYYDRQVVKRHLGVDPVPVIDTLLLHRQVAPELPHKLGFVGSVYTDVSAWKAGKEATNARTDEDLHRYNITDCVVTARVQPPLMQAVELRGQMDAAVLMHQIQGVCAGMHQNGIFVDQRRRAQHDWRLLGEAKASLKTLVESASDAGFIAARDFGPQHLRKGEEPEFNPGSVPQVRALLYEIWGLPVTGHSLKTREPTTDDTALRALLLKPKLRDEQRAFLRALRKFRNKAKLRGTYVVRLKPYDEILAYDPFATDEEEEAEGDGVVLPYLSLAQRAKDEKRRGLVLGDLRVHGDWNSGTVVTLRLSSSRPNFQNIVRSLRDMFCAEPGRALVGVDADQIELRVCAALAGCARYLEIFAKGGDPHRLTCDLIFGKAFTNASEKDQKRLRDFAKRFTYAVLYGATIETVHETITSAENDNGELLFADVTLQQTRDRYFAWLRGAPEFERWWTDTIEEYRVQQYSADPVIGHRCDFLDGEDRNAIINFKAQVSGAVIVHQATLDLVERIPFQKWGPGTGLIQQGHDALVVECPESEAKKVEGWMTEAMTRRARGLDVPFTGKAKSGFRWSEV